MDRASRRIILYFFIDAFNYTLPDFHVRQGPALPEPASCRLGPEGARLHRHSRVSGRFGIRRDPLPDVLSSSRVRSLLFISLQMADRGVYAFRTTVLKGRDPVIAYLLGCVGLGLGHAVAPSWMPRLDARPIFAYIRDKAKDVASRDLSVECNRRSSNQTPGVLTTFVAFFYSRREL